MADTEPMNDQNLILSGSAGQLTGSSPAKNSQHPRLGKIHLKSLDASQTGRTRDSGSSGGKVYMDNNAEIDQVGNIRASLQTRHRSLAVEEEGNEKSGAAPSLHAKIARRLGLQQENSTNSSTENVMKMLESSDASLRVSGALQLKRQREDFSISTYHTVFMRLCTMATEDPAYEVQVVAIRSLEAFGEESFRWLIGEKLFGHLIRTFLQCLEDTQPEPVGMAVARALGRIGTKALADAELLDPVVIRLTRQASSKYWSIRAAVIQTMGALKLSDFVNTVVVALEDPDCSVRVEAVHALFRLNGKEAYPRLAMVALQDHSQLVQEAAYLILGIPMPDLREASHKEVVPFYQWMLEKKLPVLPQGYERDLLQAYEHLLAQYQVDASHQSLRKNDQLHPQKGRLLRLARHVPVEEKPSRKKRILGRFSFSGRPCRQRELPPSQIARERHFPFGRCIAILFLLTIVLVLFRYARTWPLYAAIDPPAQVQRGHPTFVISDVTPQMYKPERLEGKSQSIFR